MAEALQCVTGFVFDELALYRVMANYRPENERAPTLCQMAKPIYNACIGRL